MSTKKNRGLTQENWKRTQLRLPNELYNLVIAYAQDNNISLNQAIIELLQRGLFPNIQDDLIRNHVALSNALDEIKSILKNNLKDL